jgi:integrase
VKWCYRKSYIDRNPMDRMEEPKGYQARDRVLTNEELRKVWNALEANTFGRIVKLLILTGQRETEVAHLTPNMLEGDTITLPSWLTKNNREHRFPIGKTAQSILASGAASICQPTSSLLFPARGTTEKLFNGWSKCKIALDKRSGVSAWRLHDLRRTFRTKWEELGIQPTVAERYINHISGEHAGIRRTYNRYDYMREMQEAVARWEDHLLTLTSPDYSNIVPIGKLTSRA